MVKRRNGASDPVHLASALLPAVVYLLLLRTSWRRTADPIIDFGREAYTAWRLSQGDLLYHDLASLFGPLAAYVDAGAFALLGPSLGVLLGVNALLIAGATAVVYFFVLRISRDLTASLAAVVFLSVFAFGRVHGSNYNFLSPYSQAAVLGLVLGIGAMACLERWLAGRTADRGSSRGWLVAAGLAAGLTMLTKPEIAVATLGASAVALAVGVAADPAVIGEEGSEGNRIQWPSAVWFTAGFAVPLLATFGAYGAAGSASLGVKALGAAFAPLLSENPWAMTFYRRWAGLEEPVARAAGLLVTTGGVGGVLVALGLLDRHLAARSSGGSLRLGRLLALGASLAAVLAGVGTPALMWDVAPRAMPILLLAALLWCGVRLRWDRTTPGETPPSPAAGGAGGGTRRHARAAATRALLVWLVFSLLLHLKMGLFPRFSHYGFYLAAPGGVALVVVLVELVPRWINRLGGSAFLPRLASLAFLLFVVLGHVMVSHWQLRAMDVRIGRGSDLLWGGGARAEGVAETLRRIEETLPADATLAVIPEGASLNYWSRRVNPTPYVSFLPPELAFHGGEQIRDALETAPPDYIVLWNRPLPDYGGGRWGVGQAAGSDILGWARRKYRCVDRIRMPAEQLEFEILRQRDDPDLRSGAPGCREAASVPPAATEGLRDR